MATYFSVDIEYDPDKAISLIKKIEKAATHLKPVFKEAREDLREIYTNHFLSNGSGTWEPLDAEYGSWKSSRYPGAPTLIQSGRLFQSVSKLEASKIDNMHASFGTNAEVAKFHQYGTYSMPKRELIFEPPMFAVKLAEKIGDYIEKEAK
jgi:phage gpG-like protein